MMKTRFLILIILFIIGLNSEIAAQKIERKIERTIDGRTYICDTISGTVYNKSNKIQISSNNCTPTFGSTVHIIDFCKKVFSEKKVELLIKDNKRNSIGFSFYCDSTGKIVEIIFYLRNNYHLITLQEIKALEDNLCDFSYKFKNACPEQKYYNIVWSLIFNRLTQP